MKKLVLVLGIVLVGFGCSTHGPSNKPEDKMANKMADKLSTVCQLTPEQRGTLVPIITKFVKTKMDNKDKYASDQTALIKADSINRTTYLDTLKKILSPDQFAKLKAFHMQQRANKQGGKPGGDPDNGGQE
ncbi:MAG TPA: hypothetical protein VK808_14115 [Bacteroidia bacterium]|nr:hypothetical protein [Bacteroidia bacterium]